MKSLTHHNEILNFVLEDGSVYVIMKNKEAKFVCISELYQSKNEDLNFKFDLDN